MKIVNKHGEVLIDTEDKFLQIKDLEPGDVFRYVRGADHNIYVIGRNNDIFHLSGSSRYSIDRNAFSPVIWYPDAHLVLGDNEVTGEDKRRPPKDFPDHDYIDPWELSYEY